MMPLSGYKEAARPTLFRALSLILFFLVFHFACQDDIFGPLAFYPYKGTVRYLGFEGGFFGIVGDDAVHYDPISLPREFQQDGLRITFDGKIRSDLASFHMWGVMFEISRIKKL